MFGRRRLWWSEMIEVSQGVIVTVVQRVPKAVVVELKDQRNTPSTTGVIYRAPQASKTMFRSHQASSKSLNHANSTHTILILYSISTRTSSLDMLRSVHPPTREAGRRVRSATLDRTIQNRSRPPSGVQHICVCGFFTRLVKCHITFSPLFHLC